MQRRLYFTGTFILTDRQVGRLVLIYKGYFYSNDEARSGVREAGIWYFSVICYPHVWIWLLDNQLYLQKAHFLHVCFFFFTILMENTPRNSFDIFRQHWNLLHFSRHATSCLFYFSQNAIYLIILPYSVQIIDFFINHALKFKYPL